LLQIRVPLMRNLKRVLLAIFAFLAVLAILAFVLENQQSISIMFFGSAVPQLPVSLIILTALLIGMMIGPVLAWILGRSSRSSRKRFV
jgi:uncharacterized integral membrane protein